MEWGFGPGSRHDLYIIRSLYVEETTNYLYTLVHVNNLTPCIVYCFKVI